MIFVVFSAKIIIVSVENHRQHIWEWVVWISLLGTVIVIQSHYFQSQENLDNTSEVCFLRFHAAIMKKVRNWIF